MRVLYESTNIRYQELGIVSINCNAHSCERIADILEGKSYQAWTGVMNIKDEIG